MRHILFLFFLIPTICLGQISAADTNIQVYNEIYSILKDKYPLFEYRNYYNLDSAYEKYKPGILKSTTQNELGQYSCKMLSELEDFHVRIYTGDNHCYALSKPTEWHKTFHNDSLQKVFWNNSDQTLYKSGFSKIKNSIYDGADPMIRYSKSDKIGYLNMTRFEVKFKSDISLQDSIKLARLMDKIVNNLRDINVMILNLRSCQGGWTEYGELIVSRLTKERRMYSRTVNFTSVKDSLSPVEHFIYPAGKLQLSIPIVILTNKVARSAAEDFILMLKQLPNIYIIGEPTWGAFSNSKEEKLFNGWYLQYSTEKVYTPNGEIFEGKGIPVDLQITNSWDDIINKNDIVISEALTYIRENKLHIKNNN